MRLPINRAVHRTPSSPALAMSTGVTGARGNSSDTGCLSENHRVVVKRTAVITSRQVIDVEKPAYGLP